MIGQKCFAPKMAIRFNIPLIFYGENEAEYGNPMGDNEDAQRSFEYFSSTPDDDLYLGGETVASLKNNFGMSASDLEPYMPVDVSPLKEIGTQVHYLGYYLRWHPQSAYYFAVDKGGLLHHRNVRLELIQNITPSMIRLMISTITRRLSNSALDVRPTMPLKRFVQAILN